MLITLLIRLFGFGNTVGKSSGIIKERISQQNFETWICPIKIVSLKGEKVNLSVPNKFFKDWLTENYLPVIVNSLSRVMGIKANVNFIIRGDKENIALEKRRNIY
jgi:hypothetical protein